MSLAVGTRLGPDPQKLTRRFHCWSRVGGTVQAASRQQYFVSPDGSRFLMNTVLEGDAASPMTLILNWKPRPPGPSR
jgi:hypothetical protein